VISQKKEGGAGTGDVGRGPRIRSSAKVFRGGGEEYSNYGVQYILGGGGMILASKARKGGGGKESSESLGGGPWRKFEQASRGRPKGNKETLLRLSVGK